MPAAQGGALARTEKGHRQRSEGQMRRDEGPRVMLECFTDRRSVPFGDPKGGFMQGLESRAAVTGASPWRHDASAFSGGCRAPPDTAQRNASENRQRVPFAYYTRIHMCSVEMLRAGNRVMKLAFSYISGSIW